MVLQVGRFEEDVALMCPETWGPGIALAHHPLVTSRWLLASCATGSHVFSKQKSTQPRASENGPCWPPFERGFDLRRDSRLWRQQSVAQEGERGELSSALRPQPP